MAAAYFDSGRTDSASFELFVRALPEERNFLVAAGLEPLLDAVEQWRFDEEDIAFLRSLGQFSDGFLGHLATLRFSGEMRAVPEGEIVFAGEPIVEITGPRIEAQLLETLALNVIGTHTTQASKAARVGIAAQGRAFVDFSARRDHGRDAAMSAARAAMIAGASATSLVAAGRALDVALSGTMAHAFVMSFDDERDAFRTFARAFPGDAVLLIDTWDTIEGAHHAVAVANELRSDGVSIDGVRLDSGDLAVLSRKVRAILDGGGLRDVRIFVSGDLDERAVAALIGEGAPIDGFGVGTRMGTSEDAPSLGVVYKLVADARGPKLKLSEGKATLPGRKQIWRNEDYDVLGLDAEHSEGRPLIEPVLASGRRLAAPVPITRLRDRCSDAIAALPSRLRSLDPADPSYDVRVSGELSALVDDLLAVHKVG